MSTKRTYQPKKIKRVRQIGFMSRSASKDGKAVLARKRRKNRWKLTRLV